jgi:2-oxoisovalerate dehydrogenase E2 component (dihydrolipoyl transacylase)
MNKEFRLPDVGEGLTEADIVTWHVQPGDTVTVNQIIVDIETAKAVVELPSPYAGTVRALLAEEGQTVDVGTPIIAVDVPSPDEPSPDEPSPDEPSADEPSPDEPSADGAEPEAEHQEPEPEPQPGKPPEPPARQAVLVGYGVKPGSTSRRPRKKPPTRPGSYPVTPSAPPNGGPGNFPGGGPAGNGRPGEPQFPAGIKLPPGIPLPPGFPVPKPPAQPPGTPPATESRSRALAKPPVRRRARDLGVDLGGLTGSGPEGSVTREDVERAATVSRARSEPGEEAPAGPPQAIAGRGARAAEPAAAEPAAAEPAAAEPAAAEPAAADAPEERIPVRGVRKHTAAAMVASAFTAPHVTEFLQVDVTETMTAARRTRELPEFTGIKVSPLLFVARALLVAVRRHPLINSSWDEAAQEIVVKRAVNLGIAVAAERGLLVPNVKDAGALPLAGLARAIDELAATARAGRATPADLSAGTITITNVGVFGVDAGTPILMPGEAAILAFGQVRDRPWVIAGELAVRKVTTLSLSFDHRIVDGELGSAVLRDVGSMLEDPMRMLAWS